MIVDTSHIPYAAAPVSGFGMAWLAPILGLIGGGGQGAAAPAGVQPVAQSSDTGLYIGLGLGAILITGIAITVLRSPTPTAAKVAGYRRRRSRR